MVQTPLVEEWLDGEMRILPNGLTLWGRGDPRAKVYAVRIGIAAGSTEDPVGRFGTAHAIEHMAFRGAGRFASKREMLAPLEEWDGDLDAYTSIDCTVYELTTDPAVRDHGLEVLGAMVAQPHLRDWELERGTIVREYRQHVLEPGFKATEMVLPLFYEDHSIGHTALGNPEHLARITDESLQAFHAAHYVPGRTVAVIAGPGETAELLDHLERVCMCFPATVGAAYTPPSPALPAVRLRTFTETWGLAEALVSCGVPYPLDSHREETAVMLRRMLSTGMSSPFFLKLREELGYCYSYHFDTETLRGYGTLDFTTEVAPERVEAFWSDFWSLLTPDVLTAERLTYVQHWTLADFQHGVFTSGAVASAAVRMLLSYGRVFPRNEILRDFLAVTLEDIHALVESSFRPEKCFQISITPA